MNKFVFFIFIVLGSITGLFVAVHKGAALNKPSSLPSGWDIQAPAQDEFRGTPQVGQGISVRSGRLMLYRQQLYASDVMSRDDIPIQGSLSIRLGQDSGLLALGLIGETTEYVFLDPHTLFKDSLEETGIPSTDQEHTFSMTPQGVYVEPMHIPLTDTHVHTIEIMTAAQQSSILALSFQNKNGSMLFEEDFTVQNPSSMAVAFTCAIGGSILGAMVSLIFAPTIPFLLRCIIGLSPIAFFSSLSHHFWLTLSIRMYLIESPVWVLERWAMGCAYTFSIFYFAMHGRVWKINTHNNMSIVGWIWIGISLAVIAMHHSSSLMLMIYSALFVFLPLLLGRSHHTRMILLFEIFAMGVGILWNISFALFILLVFRWTVLLSNTKPLFMAQGSRAAEYAFLLFLCIPLQLEYTIRSSYLNRVWSPQTLAQEKEKERIGLPQTWSGSCEGRAENKDIRIVVSGGSSTGGLYQFKEEPTSFFTTHLHNSICQNNTTFRTLTTYNYGVEDYNTQLISDQGAWLKEEHNPDILVLYIGVNDVLSKHHTQSIRERRRTSMPSLFRQLLYKSKLSTGLSLLVKPNTRASSELVPEVPVEDAQNNIKQLISDLSPASILVVPEMASSPLQPQLEEYDAMLQKLAQTYPNVHYVQPLNDRLHSDIYLADRNHLTREGNQWLGQQIAYTLQKILD